jgi:hypothetical protein
MPCVAPSITSTVARGRLPASARAMAEATGGLAAPCAMTTGAVNAANAVCGNASAMESATSRADRASARAIPGRDRA